MPTIPNLIINTATIALVIANDQSWWMRLLPKYSYLVVLVAAFWEGEVVLIAAGALCGSGYLDWRLTVLAAAIGGSAGDQVYFYAAHERAARAIKKSKRLSKWYPKVSRFVLRHSIVGVLLSRFAAGFRISIALVCATAGMPAKKYSVLSLTSGFLWASFWVAVSYQAGAHLK